MGFNHKLIQDAVKLMGREQVAKALEVPKEIVDSWLRGEGHVSMNALTRLVRAAKAFSEKHS